MDDYSKELEELRSEKRFFELIPKDILEFLCDHLSIIDQLRFARVCKSFHSSVYRRPNPKALNDTPWLIGLVDNSSSFCETIYDDQVTCYQIGTKAFKHPDPSILGYSKGWLYVQYLHNDLIQLVNLFINIHVDLPPLSTMVMHKRRHNLYAQAFALSLCKSMRPIMVAIISQHGALALCKINRGSKWKVHHHPHHQDRRSYVNVTFYHDKLYAMRKNYHKVDIFKVESNDDLKLFPMGIIDSSQVINGPFSPLLRQAYLVVEDDSSKGDSNMFIVMEYQEKFGLIFKFEIFKVEHDDGGGRLVKVHTLGDNQIMLLGDSCSEIINVKYCLSTSHVFKGNQICFMGGFYHDVGIYSLKDDDETPIWELPNRSMQCLQWIFPRFTTSECNCESH